jgi:uncharacterized protein
MKSPIPKAALDDRLGFVGTSGSGKTYNAMASVEALLKSGARVGTVDPLGVHWGLRLMADGKAPGFPVVVFGGPHGDLPLTENSGTLIGETVAGMTESFIVDLSEIGSKAGERRFMLAFLTALYRSKTNSEPLHLVIDEADMFAPQKLNDKDGGAAKLLGMMETVVRRGRIKGFIPWLITQRPAVIAKDILSQVDGLIAFKLTSSQDRDALSAWVEGSADKEDWRTMRAALPAMERGQGVVWIPGRGIMETAAFPAKLTFDSSATPKRGEKRRSTAALKPLDLGSLKERLAKVDAETKANDPAALRETIRAKDLELAKLRKTAIPALTAVQDYNLETAKQAGFRMGFNAAIERLNPSIEAIQSVVNDAYGIAEQLHQKLKGASKFKFDTPTPPKIIPRSVQPAASLPVEVPVRSVKPSPTAGGDGRLTGPQQKIVDAIAWWNALGVPLPTHAQVAFKARYSHKSGSWATFLSGLRSGGFIEPRGDLALTDAGAALATPVAVPPSGEEFRGIVLAELSGPHQKIMKPILDAYPTALSHEEAAEAAGYSHKSGSWATFLSGLRSRELIQKTGPLKAQDWMFP